MIYKIKKGKHYSRPRRLRFWSGTSLNIYYITFFKECWYDTSKTDSPRGINKLFGIAYCLHGDKTFGRILWIKYLVNSALLGWKPAFATGRFHLYKYGDIKGKEFREILQSIVEVELPFRVEMWVSKRFVNFVITTTLLDETIVESVQFSKVKLLFGYYLKPYFGGKSKAPWDMEITIDKI